MENTFRLLFSVLLSAFAAAGAQEYKFDFGDGPVAKGYIGIKSKTKYSDALGYGIVQGNVSAVDRQWDDELTTDFLTTSDELFFAVALPQGNYEVTVIFGDGEQESETTVKAENRRLIFDRVTTAAGVFIRRSATIRRMETKSTDGSVTMSIKDREKDYLTWDKVLTLRFSGRAPAIAGVEIKKKDDATTLWLCGNSTVVDQLTAPWSTWGQMIPHLFNSSVAVANYAESGLTSGGFLSMKRLSKILAEVKKGDYVFVEFGHNDQKNATDVKNYPANLKSYADQIKGKGAIPIFVIPTARQGDNDPRTSIGGLAQVMRETAQKLGVTFIDINQMVIDLNKALGADAKQLYMYTANDKTHFCEYGGYEVARCMMKGIAEKIPALKGGFAEDYTTFNPAKPDPVNILTLAKATITEGGLIQMSSSATEPQLSSAAAYGSSSSAEATGIGAGTEATQGAWSVSQLNRHFEFFANGGNIKVYLFDLNGNLLMTHSLNAGEKWSAPVTRQRITYKVAVRNQKSLKE
jgi:lysophospholipase L1-like esterase